MMRAERVGSETLLAQIVQMVSQAQRSRAPIQRLADRVAAWFVPAVIAIAAVTFVAWSFFGPEPRFAHALVNAVAVLIIACPCALGLATPIAIMVGTGRGAQAGVLIRNAEALEMLEKVDTLVVDKTGTLTEGRPRVMSVVPRAWPDRRRNTCAWWPAWSREASTRSPPQLLSAAKDRGLALSPVHDFQSGTGHGVSGEVDGRQVLVGNETVAQGNGGSRRRKPKRNNAQRTNRHLRRRRSDFAGSLSPSPIQSSRPLGRRCGIFRAEGLRVVMLTGDSRAAAEAVAGNLGIEEFEAEVLPEKKSQVVQSAAKRRASRRHGRRRYQRCARAGAGERWDRHGNRH